MVVYPETLAPVIKHWPFVLGNVEYDYNFPDAAGQAGETAPRGGVEDLADAFSTVNLSGQDAAYTQDGAYTYTTPVAVAAAGHEGALRTPILKCPFVDFNPRRICRCVRHITREKQGKERRAACEVEIKGT